ncbi:unnamed protein product [Sphenostylis stenocarpa]|uniref:Uncharacterized protein n=1 Tax=Sphenostylis stenocarpa TaxID=92480 RepID=A0AA87B9T8_9FABA|nr:unnamed protein product [Sphenostylis stenocarpa]
MTNQYISKEHVKNMWFLPLLSHSSFKPLKMRSVDTRISLDGVNWIRVNAEHSLVELLRKTKGQSCFFEKFE